MKVYLGTDHRGFKLKEKIKENFSSNYDIEDLGALNYEEGDDYPIISEKVGESVVKNNGSMGILLCGSGVGAVAAVNKVRGIRASVGFKSEQVRAGRNDDNMNVLVISADFTSETEAIDLMEIFLSTPFDKTQERYQRRVNQIKKIEE